MGSIDDTQNDDTGMDVIFQRANWWKCFFSKSILMKFLLFLLVGYLKYFYIVDKHRKQSLNLLQIIYYLTVFPVLPKSTPFN